MNEVFKTFTESDRVIVSVSNFGNIKIIYKKTTGRGNRRHIKGDIVTTTNIINSGYKQIGIKETGELLHRAVAILFVENDDPINKTYVDHIDGNKLNNRADNLRWCTASENTNNPITRKRMSISAKNKKITNKHRKNIGLAIKGKHWWNNGKDMAFTKECPGKDWIRGRIDLIRGKDGKWRKI